MNKELKKKLREQSSKLMQEIADQEINTNNVQFLGELVDIQKDICEIEKEMEYMNYVRGNYGNYGNYGEYGRRGYGEYSDGGNYGRDSYGRRGYDSKYRGHDKINEMDNEYGRYMESREYGAGEDTKRSLHYMLKSMEDFAKMLREEAQSQEEVQMIRETAQRIAQM